MESKQSILLVEDDIDIRDALQLILEEEGYDIKTSSNGKEALQYLASTKNLPILILLDLMMPEMNGYEFRHEQLKDPKIASIPTVVLSAGNQIEDAVKLNFNEAVKKPLALTTLIDVVNRNRSSQTSSVSI